MTALTSEAHEPKPDRGKRHSMLALSDDQLQIIMTAAGSLPVEKRSTFLERVACRIQLRGAPFSDKDLDDAVRRALTGLKQSAA